MTKKESLELSIILWDWLVDNPGKEKDQCPIVNVDQWEYDCALCEYVTLLEGKGQWKSTCRDCPMYGIWPHVTEGVAIECCSADEVDMSVYGRWEKMTSSYGGKNPNPYDAAFLALVLVEAFKKQLNKEVKNG